ncbi:drug resistance transporter, EmrB/QacA subfamily [Desulfotomaculum arcticum]|uniref:Drug resistance transporter, EmrB/QacA subfamily n=1 Tax=Desulfotruncus arcticus DSM 17038 TaxID=1121424 RepID=A0A1I2SCB6_9FIRM|nr:MFS transporter [Desulfotruncus arcticus]SFG50464.1 drug resistance transporter, EmrB/QacA subfamily [Desulfotomaculum arcticum] [Desulfotruncus arcticus DSM 17038]
MSKSTFLKRNRKYVIFTITSLALLISSANSTIVATALPTIQRSLKADLSWTAWIITAYQLMTLIMLPVMGRISDQWGRKRVFMVCIIIFTVSSALCAFSANIYWLILFRFLQALGGSGFMPTSMGIVGDYFKENRARAIGLFTTIFPLGGIVGPAFGGLILDYASWQVIFLINVPFGVIVLFLSYLLLEPDTRLNHTRLDFVGISFLAATMLCMMLFLTRVSENPVLLHSWLTWMFLLLGIALLWAFLRWETTTPAPVLELDLLRNRTFLIINGLNLLYGACVFGLMAFIPYYGQVAYGLSNLASGSMLTVRALGMMGMSALTSVLLSRLGYRLPMAAGFLILAVSVLALTLFPHHPIIFGLVIPNYWWLAVMIFVSGMGVGMASPSSNNAAIELMPEKIAEISGLRGMFRQTGGVLGTSLIVLTLSRFHDQLVGFHFIFGAMSLLLVAAIPFIRGVPDGRRTVA